MENYIPMALFALAGLAVQGLVMFVMAYFGARLAIRHERRISN
jgi:hypothetical protein